MGHTGIVQRDPGGKIGARLCLPALQRRSEVLRSRLCGRSRLGVDANPAERVSAKQDGGRTRTRTLDPLIKSELPRRQPIKAAIERDILSMVVFSAGFA
jgi:hypothetical protein